MTQDSTSQGYLEKSVTKNTPDVRNETVKQYDIIVVGYPFSFFPALEIIVSIKFLAFQMIVNHEKMIPFSL